MKTLVLAPSILHFREFLYRYGLSTDECKFVDGFGGCMSVAGYGFKTPVILLEGYEHNRNYFLDFMFYIGLRFTNIGFLTREEWMV